MLFPRYCGKADIRITSFFAIRQDEDLDASFDSTANPHSPVKIGIVKSGKLGVGHSVFYVKMVTHQHRENGDQKLHMMRLKSKKVIIFLQLKNQKLVETMLHTTKETSHGQ